MLYSSLGHEGTQVITPLQVATDEANLSFRRSCSHKNKWKPSALFNGISSAVLIIQSSFQCSVYIYNLQVCVQTLPEACNRSCGYYRSWGLCPRYSLVNSCIYLNAPFVIPNANHRWVTSWAIFLFFAYHCLHDTTPPENVWHLLWEAHARRKRYVLGDAPTCPRLVIKYVWIYLIHDQRPVLVIILLSATQERR